MGRNLCRHSHRNTVRTIDQQVWNARRHYFRFAERLVVIWLKVDCLFFQVRKHYISYAGHANFRIAHRRSCIAVNRSEVSLAIDQWIAHGKILRQTNDGVINRSIAMRMIFTDHVTNDACAFLVRFVVGIAELVHRPQHAPVNRFESVAHVRQGAPDDDRHRVIEIRTPHLVFDIYVIPFRSCFHPLTFPVQSALS